MTAWPCGCWHLPRSAIKAKGHAVWPPTGPYHLGDTEAALWCLSPNLSRLLSHSCNFSRERPLGPFGPRLQPVLGKPLETHTNLLTHLHLSLPPPPCPSSHILSRPYPSIKQAIQGILLYLLVPVAQNTHEGRTNSLCRDGPTHLLMSWPQILRLVPQATLSHLFPTSPSSSGSETLWVLPSGKLHGFKPTLHTTVSAQPSMSLASTQVATMREPVLYSWYSCTLDTTEMSMGGGSIKLKITSCIC